MIKSAEHQSKTTDLDGLLRQFIRSTLKSGVLTQQELARYSGISRSGLRQWLMGKRSMTMRNASRLVALFGYSRFFQFMLRHADPDGADSPQPDLIELLEQITLVLRGLLEESLQEKAAGADGGEGRGDAAGP